MNEADAHLGTILVVQDLVIVASDYSIVVFLVTSARASRGLPIRTK